VAFGLPISVNTTAPDARLSAPPRTRRSGTLHAKLGSLAVASLVVLSGLGPSGCASRRRTAKELSGAQYRLRDIEFEGNTHLSDKEIEEYLNLKETRWLPIPSRRYLLEGLMPVDAERIVELYAAHGHYETTVTDVQVRPKNDKVADVLFVIDEGEPTLVTGIDFKWPEGPPEGPADRRARPERIQTHCGLTMDQPFDVEELHDSEATMREALRDRGYAFAEVQASATVDRVSRRADVVFELTPGPFVRIGKIEIEGLQTVPEHPVRVEFEDYEDKPFSPRRLAHIQEAVYSLGVFGAVTITEADEPRDGHVDLVIHVQESKPQSIKLGVGLGLEPNRWEEYGEARYEHQNLAGTLTRFRLRVRGGYAELPALYNPEEHGPIALVEPSLRKKGLLEDELVWTLEPKFELGLQEGYKFYSPGNRVGVSRFFTRYIEAGLSHNVRFVDFFALSPTLDRNRTILGLDFRDPYILSYMEVELNLHFTDKLLEPSNGAVIGATYDIAGGIFGGQFDYNKITPEVRAYWTPLRRRLQFAARGRLGFILPFGDEPGAPFDLKLYLGGASTVRGWGLRRLSPYIDDCFEGTCDRVPVGGNTSVLGNFEVRTRVWSDLWTVAFFDMGDVQADVRTFRPQQWNYSAGPGLRYASRIGTFRLDVGVRLNNPEMYEAQPRWALHFGLGDTF